MKRLFCLFCVLILFLFSNSFVFATDYFNDDFSIKNESNWNYFCNYYARTSCNVGSTNISLSDGSITLSSSTNDFPVVVSKNNIIPSHGDFLIKIKFRYPVTTNRGVGLGIGFTGPGPYYKLFSQFGIWKDDSSGQNFKFYYNDFSNSASQGYCSNFTNSTSDTYGRTTVTNISLGNYFWHIFEIYKIGDSYSVYIDKDSNPNPVFTTSIRNNCIPKIIWFGNFISDAGGDWTTFSLDSINIVSDYIPNEITPTREPTSTPTQTPTPTPTFTPTPTLTPTPTEIPKRKKIFILPGLGASWNSNAIVYNRQVDASEWTMTPFVNNYDGLIELMEDNNLKKDDDFYVWNYDWRRSLNEIENNFDSFVKSKNLSDNDEIYLVGHSLGGVVARLWAQDNKSDGRIKQVINLGSPNLGSVETYSVWNGGEVLEYDGVSSVAFQILLGLQNKSFIITDINKIRSFAPVAKDLLPTFDYVIKNNKNVSWNNLSFVNNNLNNKNSGVSDVSEKLFLSVGVGISTPKMIKIGNRSAYDKALNLWPDGEILGIVRGDGDGTVLGNSAGFGSENKTNVNSDHGAITSNSIGLVADKLGLDDSNISFNFSDNFKDSLIIFVGSPATAELKCGTDTFEEKNGFIVARGKSYNNCDLSLSPTDNGIVHLVLGNTKNNEWKYIEKEVVLESEETLKVNFNNVWITDDKKNSDFLKKQIRLDLESLKLSKAVKSFDKGELTKVALIIFEYRNKNNERVISQRILDNLFDLALIVGPDKNKNKYSLLDNYVDLIETTVNLKSKRKTITKESAVGLAQLENLEATVKSLITQKIYPSYSMVLVMSSGYGAEAVK